LIGAAALKQESAKEAQQKLISEHLGHKIYIYLGLNFTGNNYDLSFNMDFELLLELLHQQELLK